MALIADKADCKMANFADVIVCTRFNRLFLVGAIVEYSGIYRLQGTGLEKVFSKGDVFTSDDFRLDDVPSNTHWKLIVQAEDS